ncbi:MAG TPA: DUF308 domain-containing protein [Gemmatimonadaceae bacterium]
MTTEIKSLYNAAKWGVLIRGLFGIALGIFIIARPAESIAALALVIAIWALGDGIVGIVNAFQLRGVVEHWWAMLLSGIIGVAFGIAALYYYPVLSLTFAVYWTSFWLITAGFVGIFVAMQERNMGVSWGWTLTFAVIAIIGGVFAVLRPGITLASLISLIATFGIVGGIALVVGAGRMESFETQFARAAG